MTESITPPEGQLSFSGIPSAEFVEDVDAHMAGEESAESQLKVVTSLMLDMTIIEKYYRRPCLYIIKVRVGYANSFYL